MPAKGLKWDEVKYKDTMPAQLIEMFSRGKDRCHFCAHHSISEKTFSDWIAKYPEFAAAYEVGQHKAREWFMALAQDSLTEHLEGSKLNTKLWSMLMRNRFDLTEHRKLKIPGLKTAKNFKEQMQCVLDELAEGNLTGSEAQQLSKLVETGVVVHEHTELEQRVAEIEKAGRIGVSDDEFKEEDSH
jgi:hypothetical protein